MSERNLPVIVKFSRTKTVGNLKVTDALDLTFPAEDMVDMDSFLGPIAKLVFKEEEQ